MSNSTQSQLEQIKGIGPKRSNKILKLLQEKGQTIDQLFKLSATDIKKQFQLPITVAEAIANFEKAEHAKDVKSEVALLAEKGVVVLKRGEPEYPAKMLALLGEKAPLVLYAWGNLELLEKPSVGFCGSRQASEKGLEVARDTAQQIVDEGWVVVSGHARGVDTTAHKAALERGGETIIVVPQGILDFKLRRELKHIAKPEQILVISQFPPKARWTVGYAMGRNSTIIGLSDAMILIEARDTGGTFEAGKTALRLNAPLYVTKYASPGKSASGNQYFLQHGAVALKKKGTTDRANIEHLRETVKQKTSTRLSGDCIKLQQEQLSLLF